MSGEPGGDLRRLEEVRITVRVELGRTVMRVREIERLGPGAVVTLDRLAGEPVELRCGRQCVALGEVVVQDESFAVRVTEIASPQSIHGDRFVSLNRRRVTPR